MTTTFKDKNEEPVPFDLGSIFWSKATYKAVAAEFHPFHKHDLNCAAHLITTGVGVWGGLQLAATVWDAKEAVYAYALLVALTSPMVTALLHTAFVYACLQVPVTSLQIQDYELSQLVVCGLAIAGGYLLQDVSHWIFCEKTYMDSYMGAGKAWMLVVHTVWLMPLVIDSLLMRWCFLPKLFVTRNRCVVCPVASKKACDELRHWINHNIVESKETTHVWPHKQDGTSGPTVALENDSSIMASFRNIFAPQHFDIRPVQGMNEIYVTAVGAKKEMNSDAVFYTPHTDGPYWFTPFGSLYRVLVGVTPNTMVRTRFNLQHETENQVLDMYGVVGFDYNRELHWIDHVPGETNKERRSLLKLHYVVYPKGWHWYGNLVAGLNQGYNTWARGNFLRTLRPAGMYEFCLAWWIWLTTFFNYMWEETVGWSNLVYLLATYAMGPTPFLILTSFRHYGVYMMSFAFREPAIAHGFLMRDAKLYKTVAMMHMARRILPVISLPDDLPGVVAACCGFAITIAATAQLGMVRTYFGSELGFVKPKWISGFPYNTIPHPMIVGQLFAWSSVLYWFAVRQEKLSMETINLIGAHMTCYTLHMVQEMFTSSY